MFSNKKYRGPRFSIREALDQPRDAQDEFFSLGCIFLSLVPGILIVLLAMWGIGWIFPAFPVFLSQINPIVKIFAWLAPAFAAVMMISWLARRYQWFLWLVECLTAIIFIAGIFLSNS